ncbi:hypothetical protein RFI_28202, partial [Reticulomyxa filosa]
EEEEERREEEKGEYNNVNILLNKIEPTSTSPYMFKAKQNPKKEFVPYSKVKAAAPSTAHLTLDTKWVKQKPTPAPEAVVDEAKSKERKSKRMSRLPFSMIQMSRNNDETIRGLKKIAETFKVKMASKLKDGNNDDDNNNNNNNDISNSNINTNDNNNESDKAKVAQVAFNNEASTTTVTTLKAGSSRQFGLPTSSSKRHSSPLGPTNTGPSSGSALESDSSTTPLRDRTKNPKASDRRLSTPVKGSTTTLFTSAQPNNMADSTLPQERSRRGHTVAHSAGNWLENDDRHTHPRLRMSSQIALPPNQEHDDDNDEENDAEEHDRQEEALNDNEDVPPPPPPPSEPEPEHVPEKHGRSMSTQIPSSSSSSLKKKNGVIRSAWEENGDGEERNENSNNKSNDRGSTDGEANDADVLQTNEFPTKEKERAKSIFTLSRDDKKDKAKTKTKLILPPP